MNVDKYLKRIGIKSFATPDIGSLRRLHRNHLYNIPFENLDIHSGSRIVLNKQKLERKILDGQRGGYCYELNGMFYLLLKSLGYDARMISARVSNGNGGWGPEFDHAAIIVKMKGLWLADVGFGDSFIHPLKVEIDNVHKDKTGFYKIVRHDNKFLKMMRSKDGRKFKDCYLFTLKRRKWNEFGSMNKYHQTSPESHFTRGKVCTLAFNGGRVTLTDKKITLTKNNRKSIRKIKKGEFESLLLKHFGDFKS